MMVHNEATVLIFTDLTLNGHRWSLTLRQGATEKDVSNLLALAASVKAIAEANGFSMGEATVAPAVSGNGAPPARTVKGLKGVTTNAPREGAEGGRILCNRIEIAGSRVELYAANEALKYPILNVPVWQVRNALGLEEDDPLPNFAGEWIAEWQISDKLNSKGNPYKDLTGLWRREDYEGTTLATTPTPQPDNGKPNESAHWARNADTVAAMFEQAQKHFGLSRTDVLIALGVGDVRNFDSTKVEAWRLIEEYARQIEEASQ